MLGNSSHARSKVSTEVPEGLGLSKVLLQPGQRSLYFFRLLLGNDFRIRCFQFMSCEPTLNPKLQACGLKVGYKTTPLAFPDEFNGNCSRNLNPTRRFMGSLQKATLGLGFRALLPNPIISPDKPYTQWLNAHVKYRAFLTQPPTAGAALFARRPLPGHGFASEAYV